MLRRNFLKAIGLAPVAVVAPSVEKLAGVSIFGSTGGISAADAYGMPIAGGPTEPEDPTTMPSKILGWLRGNRLPDFVLERIHRDAHNNIYRFDPDLASYRSFSLSTKFRLQGQREITRAIEDTHRNSAAELARAQFRKQFGFSLW